MGEKYEQYDQFEPRTVLLLVLADALLRAETAQKNDLQLRIAADRGEADENPDYLQGAMDARAETINLLVFVLGYYNTLSQEISSNTTSEPEL